MVKKRILDGVMIELSNWNLLPDIEKKKFEDVQPIELPKAIQDRHVEPTKRGRKL